MQVAGKSLKTFAGTGPRFRAGIARRHHLIADLGDRLALLLPETGRWAEKYRLQKQEVLRMEFKRFLNSIIRVPCQIVRTGRRIVYRILAWNPWVEVLLRGADAIRLPMRC